MARTQRNFESISVVSRRFVIFLGLAALIEQVVTDEALSLYLGAISSIRTPFRRLSNTPQIQEPGDDLLQMPFEFYQNNSRSLKWFSYRTNDQIRNMAEFNVIEAKKFKTRSRILAIGGTTTWGRSFEEKNSAFPAVLSEMLGRHWEASNIVVRAGDADYGSQCIESMIRDSVKTINDMVQPFDIIFLEFSLGSLNGIHLLLQRLRRRYPDALIIYVHLWSLGKATETLATDVLCNATRCRKAYQHIKEIKLRRLKANSSFIPNINITNLRGDEWLYSEKMVQISKQQSEYVKRALEKVEGVMYELPMPETPHTALSSSWFESDLHHLSKGGHRFVAKQIHNMLKSSNKTSLLGTTVGNQKYGTWGKGDQCISWIEDGKSIAAHFKGGTIRNFGKPTKYALHIGGKDYDNSSSIYFDNNSDEFQPFGLEIMSYNAGTYPKAQMKFYVHQNQTNDTSVYYDLDPVHPDPLQQIYHIPRSTHIDWVKPGRNKITIQVLEKTQHSLRVTGMIMCGACHEMGFGKTGIPTKKRVGEMVLV